MLRLLTRANLGGPARQCAALTPAFAHLGLRQLLVVGQTGHNESELRMPGEVLTAIEAEQRGTDGEGIVRLRELGPGLDPAGDLMSLSAVLRLGRRFRPHVVHSHTAKAGLLGALVGRALGVPIVHSFHGHVLRDYFAPPVSRLLIRVESLLCRRRSLVCSVSRSCAEELVGLGVVPAERSAVVPPAVTPPLLTRSPSVRGDLRRRLGIADGTFAIAFAGRLEPVKDPELFVATLSRLRDVSQERGRRVLACCFGTGRLRSRLAAAADGLPLRLMGSVPELPTLLPAFDLLLVTSKREGLPLVAVEALMAGVPVVGPAVPGLVDLAGSGLRLVGERSPDALVGACLDPPVVPSARRGELIAHHDPARVARMYCELYRRLVEERRRKNPVRAAAD